MQSSNASTSDLPQPLLHARHGETAMVSVSSVRPSTASADAPVAMPNRVDAAKPTAVRNACVDPEIVEAALVWVTRPTLDHLGIQVELDPESSSGAPSPRNRSRRCGGGGSHW
jgi:hypothetical protein